MSHSLKIKESKTKRSGPRVPIGIEGLDDVLGGGITPERLYLIEGSPGTGKTTLALQFLLHGVAHGESALYITLSETAEELRAVAETHDWSLEGMTVFELVGQKEMQADAEQSILHPAEVELGGDHRSDHFGGRSPAP